MSCTAEIKGPIHVGVGERKGIDCGRNYYYYSKHYYTGDWINII
jgi:CRISPR/Cas system CSM-associated protein Csm5 (group 7 of RAMP superfamily)